MKRAITVSILILAVAAILGWRDHRKFSSIRKSHAKLVGQAATLGIEADASAPIRSSRRERVDREAQVKLIAKEYTALMIAMEAAGRNNAKRLWKETQQQRLDLTERIASLDMSQLKLLIYTVQTDPDLDQASRQAIIGFPLWNLAERYPATALALIIESPEIISGDRDSEVLARVAISCWAENDPKAALRWIRDNAEKTPHLVTDETKRGLISGTAKQDPRLAFRLIDEFHLEPTDGAIQQIIPAVALDDNGLSTVAALREYLAVLPKEKAELASQLAFQTLSNQVGRENFETATAWIASLDPTPEELMHLSTHLPSSINPSERSKWIEWFDDTLPVEKSEPIIRDMVRYWTSSDYQAVGEWLAESPPGLVKNTSIQAYAETVSLYEPEHAAEWALSLPPGKQRDETLKQIYQNWPKSDSAAMEAADAFAKQHGIK